MNKILACFFFITTVCSCSNDDNGHSEKQAIDVVIESSHTFTAGDAIGLFVEKRTDQNFVATVGHSNYRTNIKWIYQENGSWKPERTEDIIYTSVDGMPLDIYAYYPYIDGAGIDKIPIFGASHVMTGKTANVRSTHVKLKMHNKTFPVKIVIPDMDVLSSPEVTVQNILSGGVIYPAKLGEENDFEPSTTKIDQKITAEKGYFLAYLSEQILEKNKHLLNIKDNDDIINYHLPEQINITNEKENLIVANIPVENPADLANTFMLEPGSEIFISVRKAYKIWKTDPLLISAFPDLSAPVTAESIWQEDLHEVIENIDIIGTGENAVIHVKTKLEKVGNAVIALKVGETVFWSWQLWVSAYNPSKKINGTTYDFNGLTFMDRNLGATAHPKAGGDRTFGLYYQWGRKDPFPTRGNVKTAEVLADIESNLVNSIIHPDVFIISPSNPNDWYTKTGNFGLDRWNSEQNTKTPFDPCPKGWRVPAEGLNGSSPWNNLILPMNEDKWGNGWHFEGNFFIGYYPAAGQRTVTGGITYAGSGGFYHTAKPDATMRFDFTSINLNFGGGRAAGRTIRCVKEE